MPLAREAAAGTIDEEGWDRLRLVTVDGTPASAWITLPQPPGFAELVGDGKTLVLVVGTQLQVLDADTLRARIAPVELQDSPERLLVSRDGRWAVVTRSHNGADGVQAGLRLVDLTLGRLTGAEIRVTGPLRRLAFSADARHILVLGPASGELSVLAVPAWQAISTVPQDDTQPITWADFNGEGQVVLATRAPDPRFGRDVAMILDPQEGRRIWQGDTGPLEPLGMVATRGGLFIAGREHDRLFAPTGAIHDLPRLAQSEPTAVLAVSSDGQLVAHAFVREVQLHDATTGASLGAPLVTDSDANDAIVQLAFSPDGNRLLARTVQGYWRQWRIGADHRPWKTVERGLQQVSSPTDPLQGLRLPTAADRDGMRRSDPGAWPSPSPRPAVVTEPGSRLAVPRRPAGLPPELVDLGRIYNFTPDEVHNRFFNVRGQMRPIPAGRLRIAGVDYDLRGMSQIGTSGLTYRSVGQGEFGPTLCVPVPPARIAAVHVLLKVSTPSPLPAGESLAVLSFGYADGSRATASLRSGFELPGYAGEDDTVARVMAIDTAQTVTGYDDDGLSNPRVANPQPERTVTCLGIASTRSVNPLVLFAMTTEPVHSAVADGPVIAGADSRTRGSTPTQHPAPSKEAP